LAFEVESQSPRAGRHASTKQGGLDACAEGANIGAKTVSRWREDYLRDFAARMDWSVATNFAGANHNPKAKINGPLVRPVSLGENVTLDASPSTAANDPARAAQRERPSPGSLICESQ